jgi:hypothetical protein
MLGVIYIALISSVLNPQTDQPAYASSHFQKMQLQGEEVGCTLSLPPALLFLFFFMLFNFKVTTECGGKAKEGRGMGEEAT